MWCEVFTWDDPDLDRTLLWLLIQISLVWFKFQAEIAMREAGNPGMSDEEVYYRYAYMFFLLPSTNV